MKLYIAFVTKSTTNFIYIVLKNAHLTIFINMKKGTLVDPKILQEMFLILVIGDMVIMK